MSKSNSFKPTQVPRRTKYGDPMTYYVVDESGSHTKVTRDECLARDENNQPALLSIDEESGMVVRLPRNEMGETLARESMRDIWREKKREERWAGRIVSPTVDDDGNEVAFEPADENADVAEIVEEKAILDTLYSALATLTQKDRSLIVDRRGLEKTVRELASKYDFKSSRSITVHERRILEILRNHEELKIFFE